MPEEEARLEEIRKRIASASPEELGDLKQRAVAVLERVRAASKYRLRSKVEEIEAVVATETVVQIEAAQRGRGNWFAAMRRLQLNLKYFR